MPNASIKLAHFKQQLQFVFYFELRTKDFDFYSDKSFKVQ